MRRWGNWLAVIAILAVTGFGIYAVWPDEPDRYLPEALNAPSGNGVPSEIFGVSLPCASDDETNTNDAANCKGMVLGLDLQGGSRIVLQADPQGATNIDIREAVSVAKEIIEDRINPFGVSESQVQISGDDRLIVELPGVSADTARDVTRPAVLMFCEPLQQGGGPGRPQAGAGATFAGYAGPERVFYRQGTCEPDVDEQGNVAVSNPDGTIALDEQGNIRRITPTYGGLNQIASIEAIIWTPGVGELDGVPQVMTGNFLEPNSDVVFGDFGQPFLQFEMTEEGEEVFGSLTDRIIGLPLGSFLDGEPIRGADGQIIAPNVNTQITDEGVISGLSVRDAQRLSTFLNNGAFPIPLKVIQQQDVDATLGDQAVRYSVQAGLVALIVIMVYMILYYRLPGVVASLALVVYTAVVLTIFKIGIPGSGPVTLTLAGVAGFVLSIGMVVDANILIFERMREELRNGRSLIPSVEAGFHRAWSSIRDSNVATLITCAILYWMGDAFASSLIKGFALTLAIGVVVSLASAIFVSRTFLRAVLTTPLRKPLWLWTDDRPDTIARSPIPGAIGGPETADA
jgi:preprotein translocase subunit SecD